MKPAFVIIAAIALSGCADQMLSNDRIRDSTARVLNQPASAITVSDRQADGPMSTSYIATTSRGSYRCTIGGGSISQLGITETPECAPLGSPLPPRRHLGQSASR
jgi:hypothetical protein